jgi:hypothetical protein
LAVVLEEVVGLVAEERDDVVDYGGCEVHFPILGNYGRVVEPADNTSRRKWRGFLRRKGSLAVGLPAAIA